MASGETPGTIDPSARSDTFQTTATPIAKREIVKNETLDRPRREPDIRALPTEKPGEARQPATATSANQSVKAMTKLKPVVAEERKLSAVNGRLSKISTNTGKEHPFAGNLYRSALEQARAVTVTQNVATSGRVGTREINGFVLTRAASETAQKKDIPAVKAGSEQPTPQP